MLRSIILMLEHNYYNKRRFFIGIKTATYLKTLLFEFKRRLIVYLTLYIFFKISVFVLYFYLFKIS